MKIKTWLGVLAALALLCSLQVAARADNSVSGETTITVQNSDVPPPSSCGLCAGGCIPGNMRSQTDCRGRRPYRNGQSCLFTGTDNGATVTVNMWFGGYGQNWPGSPTESQTTGANGGLISFYRDVGSSSWWGYYKYTGSCTNAGGTVASDTWINLVSCFLKGTPILMADGTYKNIEDVKVGDQVQSYDPDSKQFVPSGVVNTVQAQSDKYFIINGELKITPAHQLYANGGWLNSENLRVGDRLIGEDGKETVVTSIQEVTETVPVYNLITQDPHDFFASGFLVHNVNPGEEHKDHGFAKGTRIALADGRLVPIEQVKVGDRVMSYDTQKRRYAISKVLGAGKQNATKTKLINGTLRVAMKQPMFGTIREK